MDLVRLRYIGADRQRVPKLGRVVEPDELVSVPRDAYERYAWSESQWRREDNGDQDPPESGSDQDPPESGSDQDPPAAGAGDQQAPADSAAARTRKAGGRDA